MTKFIPQRKNANKHTQRGLKELENSIQRDGWIGAVTVAADGETFDGSARIETLANVMPDTEPIVVDVDGNTPVIVRRTDIPNADDPRAKRLAVAANYTASIDLAWDADVLLELMEADTQIAELLKQDQKLMQQIASDIVDDPLAEWKGMPEFEQKDLSAFQSIHIHFKTQEDINKFAELIGQEVTPKTRALWFPKAELIDMKSEVYQDEP